MPTPKVRQTPQSRVEKIFREQGFGLVLGLFAVVLAFVFVPVFVVDDLLYVHTVAPEVEGRGHAARPPAHSGRKSPTMRSDTWRRRPFRRSDGGG